MPSLVSSKHSASLKATGIGCLASLNLHWPPTLTLRGQLQARWSMCGICFCVLDGSDPKGLLRSTLLTNSIVQYPPKSRDQVVD